MESTDLHHQHHQLQEQLIGSSSLSTTIPSFSSTFSTTNNNNTSTWNPNLILLGGNLNSNINGLLSNHDHSRQNNENILVPTSNSSMIQELGFHDHQWVGINNGGNNFSSNHSTHELHLARLKEEFPNKFSDQSTINGNTSNLDHNQEFHFPSTRNYIKHENEDMNNLSEKLFLKTFSSSCHLNGLNHIQVSDGDHDFYSNNSQNCASFGSGLASSNRSEIQSFSQNLDQPCSSSPFSSSLGMNLQTLDLWNPSTKFGGCSTQSHPQSNNLGELFKQVHPSSFVLDQHMQESSHTPSYITNKISTFMTNNGGGRSSSGSSAVTDQTKRSSSSSSSSDHHHQPKSPHHQSTSNKKARTEPRSSFPPFKVRKEKLGDRIAALQQLVAPFGKTDTASVLMEAIGYIKFLQDQVETLSVPYMKSTRNMARSSSQGVSCETNENKETKQDLRSRGLCLVPLSCMSYITNDINGAGVWAIPNFGGGI